MLSTSSWNALLKIMEEPPAHVIFILATTGILGLFVIVGLGLVVVKSISPGLYGLAFLTCTLAVILHSFFHNTIFYPWVMGYLALLGGVALKKN